MKRAWLFAENSSSKVSSKNAKSVSTENSHIEQNRMLFNYFPAEILFKIYAFLQIGDLSNIAMTCKQGQKTIEGYIGSSLCTQLHIFRYPHLPNIPEDSSEVKELLEYYNEIGKLFNRTFCFYSLPLKVQVLESILHSYQCHNGLEPKTRVSSRKTQRRDFLIHESCILGRTRCPSALFYGHFLKSFSANFTQNEYQRVFQSLVHACFGQNFWLRLTNLLSKKPDECPEEELTIRLFLRRIFFDPNGIPSDSVSAWSEMRNSSISFAVYQNTSSHNMFDMLSSSGYVSSSSIAQSDDSLSSTPFQSANLSSNLITSTPIIKCDSASYTSSRPACLRAAKFCPTTAALAKVLQSYPFVHQARILFILYGPVYKGRLMWYIMCENTAADLKQLSACFGELGRILSSLWLTGHWSTSDTLAVLHEITNVPDVWLAENVACLLHSAGPRLASIVVQHKASKGYVTELAVILTSLCLVQVKIKEDLSGLLNLVGDAVQATSNTHKQEFLDALSNAFRGVIVDLYETDELDERLEDFSIILKAQSYFFRALLARVYEE